MIAWLTVKVTKHFDYKLGTNLGKTTEIKIIFSLHFIPL